MSQYHEWKGTTLTRKEKYRWAKYGGYHPLVWFLIVGTAITRIASFMSLPFLAIHLSENLHLDAFTVGLTLGMAGLTGSVGGFIGGYLSDRWGRGRIMSSSFFVWTGVFFGFFFAESFRDFLLLNTLNGLCRAFFEPTSQALMADVSTQKQRLKIFSYRYIAINVGMVVGPLLGALLYGIIGMHVFLYTGIIYTGYYLLLNVILLIYRKDTGIRRQSRKEERIHFRDCVRVVRRDRALRYFVLAGILFFVAYSQVESSLPIYMVAQEGTGESLYPVLLSINAGMVVFLQYFISTWAEKRNILTSLWIGSLFCAGGFFAFAAGSQDTAFISGIVMITLGEILIFPVSSLFIDRIAHERMRGTYYGANNLGQLGLFIGPLAGGWLLDQIEGHKLWLLMAFINMHIIIFYALGYRAYGKQQGITILDTLRSIAVDLKLISPLKWSIKAIPIVSFIGLAVLLPYPVFEQGLKAPARTETVQIHIPEGASYSDVGKMLANKQVIHNHLIFPLYATSHTLFRDFHLQPGTYQIPPDMEIQQVMSTLSKGTIQFTVPPGSDVQDVADILEREGIPKQSFYQAINQAKYDFSFLAHHNATGDNHRLEGYLFPGSYEFNRDVKAKTIVHHMLQRFEQQLTTDMEQQLKQGNLSVKQWVTVASLIEERRSDDQQKPDIAREIYDKINRNQLQLPPGPVNNPGPESLQAAANPAPRETVPTSPSTVSSRDRAEEGTETSDLPQKKETAP